MCECPKMVERLTIEQFGPYDGTDARDYWGKIVQPCKFIAVGDSSEWDEFAVEGPDVIGEIIVSRERPLHVNVTRPLLVKPVRWRPSTAAATLISNGLVARLDVQTFSEAPNFWTGRRAPRVTAQATASLTTTVALIKTLCVAGARSLSMYLNATAGDAGAPQFYLVGVKNGVENFPIEPDQALSVWDPAFVPAYTTLTTGARAAYHLDLSVDAMDFVRLYAKSSAATASLGHSWEVQD